MRLRFLCLLLLIAPVALAQTKTAVTVTDLTRIKQVGGIDLSPDGTQALYTLMTIEPTPDQPSEYEYRTHIYLTGLKPGDTRALTHGSESARQPVWSPDGKQIVFVRSVKGKGQLFVLPLGGGEAYQLTNLSYGASDPKWSPDGQRIVFSATVPMAEMLTDSLLNPGKRTPAWSLEKPGFSSNSFVRPDPNIKPNPDGSLAEIRAYLAKDVVDKKAKVINRLNFLGESTTEPDPSFTHLYLTDVRDGAIAKPLTRGFSSTQGAEWLPNGQGLLAVTDRDSTLHPDRELDNAITFIPANGSGARTMVLAEAGKTFIGPCISPDGRMLAFLTSPSTGVNFPQVGLATLSGSSVSTIRLVAFDRSAGGLRWATGASGKGKNAVSGPMLYFTASANGGVPLYRLDPTTQQVTQLTDVERGITSFDVAGSRLVFAQTAVTNPSELYAADALAKNAVKLADHNEWVTQRQLSSPEKRTFKNSLGQEIDYWIMKPTSLASGKKHPLLLNMHGGPTAMWGPGEASMWHEFQYMTAQGYGIVYANPRGLA